MASTPSGPPRARTWLRRGLVLLAVMSAAVPVLVGPARVAVRINGVAATVTTTAATVGDLLDDEGIELAAGDLLLPAPTTPIDDGLTVTILRPIEVTVVVDGEARQVRTNERSVAGAMAAAGLGPAPGAVVDPPRTSLLEDGDTVTVHTPRFVTVVVDGAIQPLVTSGRTVADAIDDAGIELGERDVLAPAAGTLLEDGHTITVTRVDVRREVERIVLAPATERRPNGSLYEGTERVVDAGSEGLRRVVYRVRYVDGEEVSRKVVRDRVVTEPSPRIVEYGTKSRPKPPPVDDDSIWYDLAECESGGRWDLNGTYDGGLQFHPDTWRRFKPSGYPDYAYQATPEEQIHVGKRVQRAYGWGAWPHCSHELGLY